MKTLASYVLVFLLGWSGAIYSYSDLFYPKKPATSNETLNGQDASSNKVLRLPTTASSRFSSKNKIEMNVLNEETSESVPSENVSSSKELGDKAPKP